MKKLLAALVFTTFIFAATSAWANACAWVSGSTKNWSDTTAWTSCGGVAPTANDTVTVSGTGTLTIDGTSGSPSLAGSVDFTGFTGTLTHVAARELDVGNASLGSLTLVSGMTFNSSSSAILKFVSTTTGNTITWGGKNIPSLTFDGVGGGWTFQDAPGTGITNSVVTLTNGSLNTNGKNISSTFASNNSNTRSLTLGATQWSVYAGTPPSTPWDITTSTGMTLSAASSTIKIQTSNAIQTFAFGGLTYGAVTSTALAGGTVNIIGANTFGALTLSSGANVSNTYTLAADQIVTGTFTANGSSATSRDLVRSSVKGTLHTITAATVVASNLDLQDIAGAGAASWDLHAVTGLSGDCGGNSGITFTTPQNDYWTGHTGNWSTNTNWKTTSGGGVTARTPLCQDTAIFDANSFSAGSQTVTMDAAMAPRTGGINFTGVTNTPAWAKTTSVSFFGPITMVSGMTNTTFSNMTYEGRGISAFTSGGQTFTSALIVDSATGTLQLADTFNSSAGSAAALDTKSGTLDASNVSVTLSAGSFTLQSGGTLKVGTPGLTWNGFAPALTNGNLTFNGIGTISPTSSTAGAITVTARPLHNPGMYGGFQ